jgi:membrane dipeptidase
MAAVLAACGFAGLIGRAVQAQSGDEALVARARAIHDRVITLDTHDDIDPGDFTVGCNYTQRLTTQVNLPKMKDGGLDVSFFIVYVGQGPLTPAGYGNAYRQAIAKFDAIHRLTEQIAPNDIGLALTPEDVRRIAASGRKVAVIGVENGYPIGTDVARVKEFYDRGGRYMSLAHNGHSQLADSNSGEATQSWRHGGVSPLGKQVIAEMNRLGMMVDVSHPSKAAMMQMVELSKAPIIASHSSARALANHPRNMDDEMLDALKRSGGVIQTVALGAYLRSEPAERTAALAALRRLFGLRAGSRRRPNRPRPCPVEQPGTPAAIDSDAAALAALPAERRAEYDRQRAAIDAKWPHRPVSVKDLIDHVDYLVKRIGIDHVGISSDFDGGGGIDGWNSAGETFNVTLELVRRGYTEAQIEKIWSGNLLRVWSEVERVARELQ